MKTRKDRQTAAVRPRRPKESKEITLMVTEKDYQREIASGVDPKDAMKPGRHIFRRFRDVHPEFDSDKIELLKTRITTYIDTDVLEFFKTRAAEPNAAGYQTQINNALRQYVEAERKRASKQRPKRSA